LALFLLGDSAIGQPAKPHAFKAATLYTAGGDQPIANGVLVVDGGKILFAGADDGAWTADNSELHDLKGRVIIPGMVDTHSHIGLWSRPHVQAYSDGDEMSGPVQSGGRERE